MSFPELLPFLVSSLLMELMPGPNMGFVILVSLNRGRNAGFYTIFGIAIGLLIIGALAAFGFAQIIGQYPQLYELIRWAGAIYLAYLALDLFFPKNQGANWAMSTEKSGYDFFLRGLITNLLNPKAAVFFLIALPQFIPERIELDQELLLSLELLLIYVAIATMVHTLLVLLGARFKPFLDDSHLRGNAQKIMALMLFLVAIWQFISTAR